MSGIRDSSQRRSAAERPARGSLRSSGQGWGAGVWNGVLEGMGAGMVGGGVIRALNTAMGIAVLRQVGLCMV